jgi:ArsR family metal-binding transcriptional regulator
MTLEPYLTSIALVGTIPCPAYPGKIIIVGRPSRGLSEVMPYLASLPNVIGYNLDSRALTLRRQPGFITLLDQTIYITRVDDADQGVYLLAALTAAINATWQHRSELTPASTRTRAPGPLDVWNLLPHTNCRECGEPTCMAFAFGLLQQTHKVAECPRMRNDPAFGDHRATLEAMI